MKWIASLLLVLVTLLSATAAGATVPVTLKGSPASMQRQNQMAKQAGYVFTESSAELEKLVGEGALVRLTGNRDYVVKKSVSYPYAQPEMRLFIERLAEQYRAGTGEKLVVTSLTRPQARQPGNSHELSVHPTGMAVDLRISSRRASRAWLEAVLLKLERQGLLDITRERWPPHYHVALFTEAYRAHVEAMIGSDAVAAALAGERPDEPIEEPVAASEKMVANVSLNAQSDTREEPRRWPLLLAGSVVLLAAILARRRRAA